MSAPQYTKDALKPYIEKGVAIIGDHSYGAPILRYWPQGYKFHCGKYCSIADRVQVFMGGYHRPDWVSMYPFPAFPQWGPEVARIRGFAVGRGDVVVENDVWIGSHATLMSGVKVGNGAVIGAHAVVSKDVPPFAVVVGNPARIVKYRFDDLSVRELLAIAWWDWPEEKIQQHIPQLLSGDVQGFIETHRVTAAS